ncbi:hypothetical protein llap_14105 [Limosa lapponica baueri]|uniref:Uncharacterized protein n=1 Tax=Limosa lapponica baueri TaxID=1758121 RepID=A0A2I0TP43_LIMLA|nr:hypothetical protein llap_14105 [Limosa lapponica baueri]
MHRRGWRSLTEKKKLPPGEEIPLLHWAPLSQSYWRRTARDWDWDQDWDLIVLQYEPRRTQRVDNWLSPLQRADAEKDYGYLLLSNPQVAFGACSGAEVSHLQCHSHFKPAEVFPPPGSMVYEVRSLPTHSVGMGIYVPSNKVQLERKKQKQGPILLPNLFLVVKMAALEFGFVKYKKI